MEEVAEIIDKLLVNNDKHISNIIMDYVYPRCCHCNKLFDERDKRLRFDNSPICNDCFLLIDWKVCYRCKNYFDRINNIFCRSCLGKCRIYCCMCLENNNRIPDMTSLQLIDEIIRRVN
jgi:hypothetical protein